MAATGLPETIGLGEGLGGPMCAWRRQRILLSDVAPEFMPISSSLGEATPVSIVVLPVLFEGQTKAVIELASLQHVHREVNLGFLDQLTPEHRRRVQHHRSHDAHRRSAHAVAAAHGRTADRARGNCSRPTRSWAPRRKLLAEQNAEVERKNTEVEQARHALEEKAAELALTSKYKSEFLANMSHELRTPLNSILILESAAGRECARQL